MQFSDQISSILHYGSGEVEDEEEAVELACLLDGRRMKDVTGRIRVFMENVAESGRLRPSGAAS